MTINKCRHNLSFYKKKLSKSVSCFCSEMPKFTKNWNNCFHDECSNDVDGSRRIMNLRAFGLDELTQAFAKFIIAREKTYNLEKRYPHLQKLCSAVSKKEEFFSIFVKTISSNAIEKKVSKNLVGRNMYICSFTLCYS